MAAVPRTMKAVVTRGNGGFDMLDYTTVPVPRIGAGEVLIKVLAAGVNNTEINTRLGWYSSSVRTATDGTAADEESASRRSDGGWDKPTPFPFIQGTDCCGEVVGVGSSADRALLNRRVLVRSCMRPAGFESFENTWLGSDFDGAFAEFVRVPASEVFPVVCDMSDEELGTVPCAYGTSENMLHRAGVKPGDHVVVTGGSGGVGSAAVQLALRRGATVTAVTSERKADRVRELGATAVVDREADLSAVIGPQSADVVVDNVGGPQVQAVLDLIRRGGVYVTSGAIGGPFLQIDIRTVYLRDIRIIGCTAWDEPVFADLVSYIERGEIRPVLAGSYPLARIEEAQRALLRREHVGKFVLVP